MSPFTYRITLYAMGVAAAVGLGAFGHPWCGLCCLFVLCICAEAV